MSTILPTTIVLPIQYLNHSTIPIIPMFIITNTNNTLYDNPIDNIAAHMRVQIRFDVVVVVLYVLPRFDSELSIVISISQYGPIISSHSPISDVVILLTI